MLAMSPTLLPLGFAAWPRLENKELRPLVARGWDVIGQEQIQLLDMWKAGAGWRPPCAVLQQSTASVVFDFLCWHAQRDRLQLPVSAGRAGAFLLLVAGQDGFAADSGGSGC